MPNQAVQRMPLRRIADAFVRPQIGDTIKIPMRIAYFFTIGIATLLTVGCGGTYVDDKRNFERAFESKRPQNVQVLHSFYYISPHFTEEHEYYFQMKPASDSTILKWLTGGPN